MGDRTAKKPNNYTTKKKECKQMKLATNPIKKYGLGPGPEKHISQYQKHRVFFNNQSVNQGSHPDAHDSGTILLGPKSMSKDHPWRPDQTSSWQPHFFLLVWLPTLVILVDWRLTGHCFQSPLRTLVLACIWWSNYSANHSFLTTSQLIVAILEN